MITISTWMHTLQYHVINKVEMETRKSYDFVFSWSVCVWIEKMYMWLCSQAKGKNKCIFHATSFCMTRNGWNVRWRAMSAGVDMTWHDDEHSFIFCRGFAVNTVPTLLQGGFCCYIFTAFNISSFPYCTCCYCNNNDICR